MPASWSQTFFRVRTLLTSLLGTLPTLAPVATPFLFLSGSFLVAPLTGVPHSSWGFARPVPRIVPLPRGSDKVASLSLSPFAPAVSEAPSVDDRDLDCLDDIAEGILASEFSPLWIFDSRENARRADEPLTLFQVHTGLTRDPLLPPGLDGCERLPENVVITYAPLFAHDGGYASSWICGDAHPGDNAAGTVRLQALADRKTFQLTQVNFGMAAWPSRVALRFINDKHPVIYLSAGKHHFFPDTRHHDWSSPYSNWACRDAVDGRGHQAFARLEDDRAPIGFLNVGEREFHPSDTFVTDLTPLGYPQENAWDTRTFCGGLRPNCSPVVSPMGRVWR